MDAMIENVRNSLEVGVRKMLTGAPKKSSLMPQVDKKKNISKVFGIPLIDLCEEEGSTVPYIIKDLCTFIQDNHLHCEGIFRLSSSSLQTSKLREAFEQYCGDDISVTVACQVDGHTAANVLKQFLRQLPDPLIPDAILKLSKELKCVSDENYASTLRATMESWPKAHSSTLQYLLSFLQLVMRNAENRMTVTGLAVVFGPNVFRIAGGIEGLEAQGIANQTFERLLLMSDIICGKVNDDQGYLDMISSHSSPIKPSRSAPPIPKQARPLPAPPVPVRSSDDADTASPPSIPHRSASLQRSAVEVSNTESLINDAWRNDDQLSDDYNDVTTSDGSASPSNHIVDETIRHIVRKRLFHVDISTSSFTDDVTDDITLLPSLTLGRVKGPRNRRKPSRSRCMEPVLPQASIVATATTNAVPASSSTPFVMTSLSIPVATVTASTTTVTTPDSGCLTAEDESSHPVQNSEVEDSVIIPKLDLNDAINDDVVDDVTEKVPPLDLSEVTQTDEVIHPVVDTKPQKTTPTKERKRRRNGNKTSPVRMKTHHKSDSEPMILIEPANFHHNDNFSPSDISANNSPSRWRDAWSTDDESYPTMTDANRHEPRYPIGEPSNEEVTPTNKYSSRHLQPHYHRRHHHHSNHITRAKLSNSLKDVGNHDVIFASLQEILTTLDLNRKRDSRPEDLTLMTRDEIRLEKLSMQRELLKYEGRHGRPSSKKEKEIMRNIYDRYRMVKRLMADTFSPPAHTSLRHHNDAEQDYENCYDDGDEFGVTQTLSSVPSSSGHTRFEAIETSTDPHHISADLGINELHREQKQAKGERKRLRRKIRDFEREIEQQHGRSVIQADRVVMTTEYNEYRALKAKLRLLDALIEKYNAQH